MRAGSTGLQCGPTALKADASANGQHALTAPHHDGHERNLAPSGNQGRSGLEGAEPPRPTDRRLREDTHDLAVCGIPDRPT